MILYRHQYQEGAPRYRRDKRRSNSGHTLMMHTTEATPTPTAYLETGHADNKRRPSRDTQHNDTSLTKGVAGPGSPAPSLQ